MSPRLAAPAAAPRPAAQTVSQILSFPRWAAAGRAFTQRWQERTEADDPELAKEIQRRFEARRTDVAPPFSLTATYLVSFAGRLALPYVLGWTCYVLCGGA